MEAEADEYAGLSRRAKFRRRGIYLLPNLITSAALFAGFYSIVAGMDGNFIPAALAMFVAMALDTADGRVARMTHTESAFGAEYDSLSDMVAFGVAPALVAFSWGLNILGQLGWMVTFVFMACAALRLARFNTKGDNSAFTGLGVEARQTQCRTGHEDKGHHPTELTEDVQPPGKRHQRRCN
ncbi:MAG: phosphatidylcholine/phosphatidylserine synthase, partial [Pseudomonadales bacterium]